jgi:hypothetical protein
VLPCLKEAKWVGRGDSVCRALWEKQSSNFMPWVAIGYDRPHTFEFISTKGLAELNTTEEALHARALEALRARPAKWQPVELDVEGTPLKMLVCTGDYFSAEHILDPEFMKEAQRILKAPGLLVGVPRRGFLMATVVGEKDHRLLLAFGAGVAGQYSRGESALISPMLFAMKDGRIVAIIEDIADAIVPDGEPKGAPKGAPGDEDDEDEEEGDPGEPYVSAMVTRNDRGTEDVHLMAGGPDGDRLAKAIEVGFQGLLKEHARRPEFSGHIQIVVLGNTPVSERKNIPSLLEHLRGICNDLSKGNDKRYRVSLTYQKNSLSDVIPSTPPPRAATSSTPRASVPPPQSGPSFLTRFKWRLAGAIAAAVVAWVMYGRGGGVSYPPSVTYSGDSLPQATKWDRGGLSGVVYAPAGEHLPAASRQLGVIISSQHDSGASLLRWIQQQQAAQSTAQIHHDAVADGERCHVGIAFLNDFVRPYLSLQSCRTRGKGAACIELDDELDNGIVASCLNRPGCFEEVCEERWQSERGPLTRALTAVVGQ